MSKYSLPSQPETKGTHLQSGSLTLNEVQYPVAPAQNAKPVRAHHSPSFSHPPHLPVSPWVPRLRTCRPSDLGLGAGKKAGSCRVEDLDGAVEGRRHRNRSYRSHQSGLSMLLLMDGQ